MESNQWRNECSCTYGLFKYICVYMCVGVSIQSSTIICHFGEYFFLLLLVLDMSSTSTHDVCGSRAPPPTPTAAIQGNGSSGIVNNDAFAAFLEKSLGISSLVLPARNNVSECDIPVIDLLSGANGGDSSGRDCLIRSLAKSASDFGFFQVINHGISFDLVERAEGECAGLFEVPLEQKEMASRSPGAPFGYDENGSDASTSVRLESFWLERDAGLLEEFIRNIWPEGSASFSHALSDYSSALEKVASQILELLSEGLGLEGSCFAGDIGSNNASLLCLCNQKGIPKSFSGCLKQLHPYILSLQYQKNSYGCYLFVDRSWVLVYPKPGSLLVTVGDITKVWSNAEYRSAIGRPVVSTDKPCISMALLYSPSLESIICPKPELLNSDKRPHYASFAFKDYASRLWKQRFLFKDPLEQYRI